MMFLANQEDPTKYLQILRAVMANDQAFRGVLKNLAEDAKQLQTNRIIADIWNNYLEPSAKNDVGHMVSASITYYF